jgi:hypothetical protein
VARVQVTSREKILYKYVVKSSSAAFSWEDRIPDRELKIVGPSAIINDGHFNQLSRAATFSALERPNGMPAQAARQPQLKPGAGGGGVVSYGGAVGGGLMKEAGSGEAGAALKAEVMRHEQLLDRVAELQRQLAVEKAEIERLSAAQSGTMAASGTDPREAAQVFAEVQEKLASLEQKRTAVHEQARHSSERLARVKQTATEMEADKLRVASELHKELERKAQLHEAVAQTQEALRHARGSALRIARVTQQAAETKEELAARLKEQVHALNEDAGYGVRALGFGVGD